MMTDNREEERVAAELAWSLFLMRATLESTTDGILVTDRAGKITVVNKQAMNMWNILQESIDQSGQRGLHEIIDDKIQDPKEFIAQIDEILASSTPETCDVLELVDGRVVEVFSRILFVEQQNMGRVWSFRDITRRKHAEREQSYLRSIIADSSDAIVSKTLDGIVTSWNPAAERIFGYTAEEAIGRPISIIVPPERIDEEWGILNKLRKGQTVDHFETLRVRKDGRIVHVSLTISPVRDPSGHIIGASKIARDITERLQLHAREQAARARAEEASRLKDDFLATVSHELRTPLNAILGWALILRSGDLDEAKSRHAAEVIERNARTQARVIEDLLDISRIITGKLRLNVHTVMPMGAIESALESVRLTAEAKGLILRSVLDSKAGPILADPARLQQIVWNLLSNAIKFTPKGGVVELRLKRFDSQLEIAVHDTGQGIRPEFLPHVFERFRQADASSSRSTAGLGLGLSIVRHLVELHGGLVSADSAGEGKGATFKVSLPLQEAHAGQSDEKRIPENGERENLALLVPEVVLERTVRPNLNGVRILVVDDQADTRDLLRVILEECGAEVREAGSARQAFDYIKEWRPTVFVSDIGMPGEDGYVLIRRVREWGRESGTWIPAVALTAYARTEDRMRALLAGYQVHMAKPIEPAELALTVAGVVQSRPS